MDAGGIAGLAGRAQALADLDRLADLEHGLDGGEVGVPGVPDGAVGPIVAQADVVAVAGVAALDAVDDPGLRGDDLRRAAAVVGAQVDALVTAVGIGPWAVEGIGNGEPGRDRVHQEEAGGVGHGVYWTWRLLAVASVSRGVC